MREGVTKQTNKQKTFPGLACQGSPVPNFDRVPRGGQNAQVVRAEGQRADIGAVPAECETRRLIGRGGLVRSLQAVGLNGVVLQQQRHLQLATST